MTWVAPDAALRPAFLRALFAANLRSARRYGRVDRDPGGAGAAIWLAPGQFPMLRRRMLLTGHLLLPLRLSLTGWRHLARLTSYALMLHHRTAPGPHWYLNGIGVEPSRRCQGIGETLLAAGAARADRDRLPCYLETAGRVDRAALRTPRLPRRDPRPRPPRGTADLGDAAASETVGAERRSAWREVQPDAHQSFDRVW